MKIHVTIFNYQREEMLDNTLAELEIFRVRSGHQVEVSIIDDGSDYSRPQMIKFPHGGKRDFWRKWRCALQMLEDSHHDLYMFVPNDFSRYDFDRILSYHSKMRTAYVFNLANDGREMCWNVRKPQQFDGYKRVFFTDCGFFCNRKAIEMLDFNVAPVHRDRFITSQTISSGVGQQLTERLNKLGVHMYLPDESLVFHGDHESLMHPLERRLTPLVTHRNGASTCERPTLPIVVGIATMDTRKNTLRRVLDSLASQTMVPDRVYVYNNDQNEFDATDNGKFYGLSREEGPCIFLSMDDDILYPPTYVADMVRAVQENGCIVTHHGRKLMGMKRNYYTGHVSFSCLYEVSPQQEQEIDVAGTGVTAFRTDYFNPVEIFHSEHKRMSDCVFSLEAARQGKRILLLRHREGYIRDICDDQKNSCFAKESRGNGAQNSICDDIYFMRRLAPRKKEY